MRYGTVCSGIEAPTVAWHLLGWAPQWFAEIAPFPSAVLAHHYPHVPNLGDMTKVDWSKYAGSVDLVAGGTPCQAFSVAGLRKGLADPRGNLTLEFLRVLDAVRPTWVVWENVPGVLSINGGRDFGTFLGGLGQLGYGFAYRVLDAQYFGVPQRRRRVFLVGHSGDWRRAAAVLFERHSLQGHPAPRREAGKGIAGSLSASLGRRCGVPDGGDTAGQLIPQAFGGNNTEGVIGGSGRMDFESETFIAQSVAGTLGANHGNVKAEHAWTGQLVQCVTGDVTHALKAEGCDGSEDGTGRGAPLVPVSYALGSHAGAADGDASNSSHASGGPVGSNISEELAYSLRAGRSQSIANLSAVRRLTPEECEALQGLPREYTKIPWRGKPAGQCPDGPRYKAIGNSWAVPAGRWVGERIQATIDAVSGAPEGWR